MISKTRSLFRDYHKIVSILGGADKNAQIPITREIVLLGKPLTLERVGMCVFSQIRFLKQGQEVYKIERGNPIAGQPGFEDRFEHFFGFLRRHYQENRFSFCEYCDTIRIVDRIPSKYEIRKFQESLTSRDPTDIRWDYIDNKYLEMYEEYARRILNA